MTRTEFNRKFAATDSDMNYTADDDSAWTEVQIAEINDAVFSAVGEMDADDDQTEQAAKSAFEREISKR